MSGLPPHVAALGRVTGSGARLGEVIAALHLRHSNLDESRIPTFDRAGRTHFYSNEAGRAAALAAVPARQAASDARAASVARAHAARMLSAPLLPPPAAWAGAWASGLILFQQVAAALARLRLDPELCLPQPQHRRCLSSGLEFAPLSLMGRSDSCPPKRRDLSWPWASPVHPKPRPCSRELPALSTSPSCIGRNGHSKQRQMQRQRQCQLLLLPVPRWRPMSCRSKGRERAMTPMLPISPLG